MGRTDTCDRVQKCSAKKSELDKRTALVRRGAATHSNYKRKRTTNMGTATEKLSKSPLTERPAWKALAMHYETVGKLHLRQLFSDDRDRGKRLTATAAGIYLDYSKNRITDETLKLLFQLATESGLRDRIDAMF